MPDQALSDLKVIEWGSFISAPFCTKLLADMGAEVIKIEPPITGERGRKVLLFPGLPVSPYFETYNRGFKCLTLNYQKEKGLEILYKLVKDADVFSKWLLTDFEHNNQTVMLAPAAGFYATPGLGKNEVRIAYVLKLEDLKNAVECLRIALEQYRD